jgi:hypothetical protein
MALKDVDVEVDLDDDILTVIPTPGTIEFGNATSLVVGNAGVGDEVDLDDDTLTIIPTPGTIESSNATSLVVGNAGVEDGDGADSRVRAGVDAGVWGGVGVGAGDGVGVSEKGQFQKKERQKTSKI